VDRAHVQAPDPSRAEIASRYLQDDKGVTPGPGPQEALAEEQASEAADQKCSCQSKQLPAKVVKAIQAFLKGGPLTSDISVFVPSYAKSSAEVTKALADLIVESSATTGSANVPGMSNASAAPTVRRGEQLVPAGARSVSASRLALQGNGAGTFSRTGAKFCSGWNSGRSH
jgi:hypothetical protein